jgi:hypothetical protein
MIGPSISWHIELSISCISLWTFLYKRRSLRLRNAVITWNLLLIHVSSSLRYHSSHIKSLHLILRTHVHLLLEGRRVTYRPCKSHKRLSLKILLRGIGISLRLISEMSKVLWIVRRHEDRLIYRLLAVVHIHLLLLLICSQWSLLLLLIKVLPELSREVGWNVRMIRLKGFRVSAFRWQLMNLLWMNQWSKMISRVSEWLWIGIRVDNLFWSCGCENP